MKKKFVHLIISILNAILYTSAICAEELKENSEQTQAAIQLDNFMLPPIRRIGLDTITTNIDEFRNYMRKKDRLLHGVAALPYNEQDIRRMLVNDLEHQTKNTGRFWDLSFTQFLNVLPALNKKSIENAEKQNNISLKQKLELDYNLDAWVKASIYFAPDQTLVRLTLKGIGSAQSTWAREDILLEAQAGEDKIKTAFAESLSRIISTIGHDGKVTYTRENLMTVDFGTERGLTRGQKIIAGYVVLTSFHPQSGEFLRAERIPIYELKILESRKGSSLCQITAIDKIKYEQITKSLNSISPVILAWRPEKVENQLGWREPYDPNTAPMLGAVESGFGVPLEKTAVPSLPDNMAEPTELQNRNGGKVAKTNNPPSSIAAEKTIPSINIIPEANTTSLANNLGYKRRSHFDNPKSWNFKELTAGGGMALGSFAQGDATSFPATILNRLNFFTFVEIDSKFNLFAEPYVQYVFYNGGTTTGSSYYIGSKLYNAVWSNKLDGQNIYLGGGVEATGGMISGSKKSNDLTNLQLEPSIKWESNLSGLGKYNIEGGFSIFDFIQGYPVWNLHSQITPFELAAKELGFDIGLKRYKSNWIEFTIGVNWDFLPSLTGHEDKT